MITRKFNKRIFDQYVLQGSCCFYCKQPVAYDLITRDHFNPVSKGNTLVDNKIFACRKCNSFKGDLTIDEFKERAISTVYKVLRNVVDNNWMITDKQVDTIRRCSGILKTVNGIIANDYKPDIIFT